jgi:hypothetical protein
MRVILAAEDVTVRSGAAGAAVLVDRVAARITEAIFFMKGITRYELFFCMIRKK